MDKAEKLHSVLKLDDFMMFGIVTCGILQTCQKEQKVELPSAGCIERTGQCLYFL